MAVKRLLFYLYILINIVFIPLFIPGIFLLYDQHSTVKSHDLRIQSEQLASELCQNSTDLTRMAQAYVVNGDPKYKQMYQEILDIRNGNKPRPLNYNSEYWDLVENEGEQFHSNGEAISLLELMKRNGFTEEELAKFAAMQVKLDDLARIEKIAMNACKGIFNDEARWMIRPGESNQDFACRILYDKAYQRDKAELMKLNSELSGLVDQRTQKIIEKDASKKRFFLILLLIFIIILYLFVTGIYIFLQRVIVNTLRKINGMLENIAQGEGDLTQRLNIAVKIKEIGDLTKYFNQFMEKVQNIIRNIFGTTTTINSASESMMQTASAIAKSTEQTNIKTSTVSTTIKDITGNIRDMSEVMAETSDNMNHISASVEEMSSTIKNMASASAQISSGVEQASELVGQISNSINNVSNSTKEVSASVNSAATAVKEINISLNEISKNCERSIHITSDADLKAKDTNTIIEKLNDSSRQIGKIINVISDIADQTNMLALNAAIEAAGAGEAGKGFAVVANEVKELAKQTAEATDEISQQIQTMQINMSDAVKAVEMITEVIKEITTITSTIAAAVTEQSATTGDISNAMIKAAEKVNFITKEIADVAVNSQNTAKNVIETSKGVEAIARSASELSIASYDVAKNTDRASIRVRGVAKTSQELTAATSQIADNMAEISAASEGMLSGMNETNESAKILVEIAQRLEVLVKQFKI